MYHGNAHNRTTGMHKRCCLAKEEGDESSDLDLQATDIVLPCEQREPSLKKHIAAVTGGNLYICRFGTCQTLAFYLSALLSVACYQSAFVGFMMESC